MAGHLQAVPLGKTVMDTVVGTDWISVPGDPTTELEVSAEKQEELWNLSSEFNPRASILVPAVTGPLSDMLTLNGQEQCQQPHPGYPAGTCPSASSVLLHTRPCDGCWNHRLMTAHFDIGNYSGFF